MRKIALVALLTILTAWGGAATVPVSAEMQHTQTSAAQPAVASSVVAQISRARLATAKYAMNLARAKADGYVIITPHDSQHGIPFLESQNQRV